MSDSAWPVHEIEIPQSFRDMPRWWTDGTEWLDSLTGRLADKCVDWRLRPDGIALHGSNAIALPVTRDGVPLLLRMTPPHSGFQLEIDALRFWDGRGTVQKANPMGANADKPVMLFAALQNWEAWLEEHVNHDGVRLQLRKKHSAVSGITYPQALDVALCFGWIDGQVGSLDDDYFLQVFTPRMTRSVWSKRNRDSVEVLIAEGRMRPAGLEEIDHAKADGRWEAAYSQKGSPMISAPPSTPTRQPRSSSRNSHHRTVSRSCSVSTA
jgi:hypothetical protein